MTEATEKRAVSLIAKYQPDDAVKFRNAFREVIASVGASEAQAVTAVRDCLEWWHESKPGTADAVARWLQLYQQTSSQVPVSLWVALLKRFPDAPPDLALWEPLVLSCHEAEVIEVLQKKHLVTPRFLNTLAKTQTQQFCQSAALDALVTHKSLKEVLAVWQELVRTRGGRAQGLMGANQILLAIYSSSPKKTQALFANWLSSEPELFGPAFDYILADLALTMSFCAFLLSKPKVVTYQTLLVALVEHCRGEVSQPASPLRMNASLLLSRVRLEIAISRTHSVGSLGAASAGASQAAIAAFLRRSEAPDFFEEQTPSPIAIVSERELGVALQEHFAKMRDLGNAGVATGNYAQYAASKIAITRVLEAIEQAPDNGPLRDALEVAVHNLGVRPFCQVDDEVVFDPHLHRTEDTSLFPGDPAIVVAAGRQLEGTGEGVVLIKARVATTNQLGTDHGSPEGRVH